MKDRKIQSIFQIWKKGTLIKKTIKSLQLADNSIIKTDSEILKEAESFYRELYSSCNPQVDDTFYY